jgi:exosortase A-associated hydrolase 1
MDVTEKPIVFDCEGDDLVGMLHLPERLRSRGLILVVAGGPQYRGGVGRLQVQMARELAAQGVPVLRFDHRGIGDSAGEFKGFEHVEADLAAAIAAFRQHAPGVREFVLWGGCDAAAAVMLNAWKYPEVTGIVTGNPFVHSAQTAAAATINQHYRKRFHDRDFWIKVLRLQYNPLPAIGTLARALWGKARGQRATGKASGGGTFVDRMCVGLSRYKGDMLMVMAGRSLVRMEFDELVASNTGWQRALRSPRSLKRHDMPNSDQTYSAVASRAEVIAATARWMLDAQAFASDPAKQAEPAGITAEA